jgi:cytochrome c oxidase subunit 4
MSEHADTEKSAAESGNHHGSNIKSYLMVFVALCVLTTASFFTYSDFWRDHFSPQAGWAFMMAISVTKAMLVVLFFMHLLYEAKWKYVLTVPTIFMSIFLVCMLIPDVGFRMSRISRERRHHMAVEPTDSSHAETPHSENGADSENGAEAIDRSKADH